MTASTSHGENPAVGREILSGQRGCPPAACTPRRAASPCPVHNGQGRLLLLGACPATAESARDHRTRRVGIPDGRSGRQRERSELAPAVGETVGAHYGPPLVAPSGNPASRTTTSAGSSPARSSSACWHRAPSAAGNGEAASRAGGGAAIAPGCNPGSPGCAGSSPALLTIYPDVVVAAPWLASPGGSGARERGAPRNSLGFGRLAVVPSLERERRGARRGTRLTSRERDARERPGTSSHTPRPARRRHGQLPTAGLRAVTSTRLARGGDGPGQAVGTFFGVRGRRGAQGDPATAFGTGPMNHRLRASSSRRAA